MPGYVRVRVEPQDRPSRICFDFPTNGDLLLTPDQQDLRNEIISTERLLRLEFPEDDTRDGHFTQLQHIAESGLVGDATQPTSAMSELGGLRDEIAKAALSIREDYLARLRRGAIPLAGVGLAVIVISFFAREQIDWLRSITSSFTDLEIGQFVDFVAVIGYATLGLLLGALFFAHMTNRIVGYDQIGHIRRYDYSISTYYFYLFLLLTITLFVLYKKILWIGLAGLNLNNIDTDPTIGIAVGILCGLAEVQMARLLGSRLVPTIPKK